MGRFSRRLRRYRFGLLDQPGLSPEPAGDVEGIDPSGHPPAPLVADPVQGAVVRPAQRHHEFVADLAAQRPSLGEAQVVRVGGGAGADQAGLPGDEPQVLLVAVALGLGDLQQALVDAGRRFCDAMPLPQPRDIGRLDRRSASIRPVARALGCLRRFAAACCSADVAIASASDCERLLRGLRSCR